VHHRTFSKPGMQDDIAPVWSTAELRLVGKLRFLHPRLDCMYDWTGMMHRRCVGSMQRPACFWSRVDVQKASIVHGLATRSLAQPFGRGLSLTLNSCTVVIGCLARIISESKHPPGQRVQSGSLLKVSYAPPASVGQHKSLKQEESASGRILIKSRRWCKYASLQCS
jgi:hypothetical protein